MVTMGGSHIPSSLNIRIWFLTFCWYYIQEEATLFCVWVQKAPNMEVCEEEI